MEPQLWRVSETQISWKSIGLRLGGEVVESLPEVPGGFVWLGEGNFIEIGL